MVKTDKKPNIASMSEVMELVTHQLRLAAENRGVQHMHDNVYKLGSLYFKGIATDILVARAAHSKPELTPFTNPKLLDAKKSK